MDFRFLLKDGIIILAKEDEESIRKDKIIDYMIIEDSLEDDINIIKEIRKFTNKDYEVSDTLLSVILSRLLRRDLNDKQFN